MAAKVIEELTAYGCDTAGAIERFVNNEAMYIKFLNKFLDDPSFSQVKPSMEDDEAFLKTTHTLKGVAGNLGFTPLYDTAAYMVERCRAGEPDEGRACYGRLEQQYNEIYNIIKNNA